MNQFRLILIAAAVAALGSALPANAQNLSIWNGNGQIICFGCIDGSPTTFRELAVKVTDTAGNPVSGTQVNWTAPTGTIIAQSSFSDANGIATTNLIVPFGYAGTTVQQFTITASTGSSSVNFTETVAHTDPNTINQFPQNPVRISPIGFIPGTSITGPAGSVSSTPMTFSVSDTFGRPVANVNMFLEMAPTALDTAGVTVQCRTDPNAGPGMALSDAQGNINCYPQFGGTGGTSHFNILVGGARATNPADPNQTSQWYFKPFASTNVIVTPGTPGSISITQGNNQTVNPGQSVPTALGIQVTGSNGNPLGGQAITWSLTPSGAATLTNTQSTTDVNGRATTGVTVSSGAASGNITVSAKSSDGSQAANFTITVVPAVTVTGFQIYSGNNQSAAVSTAFGAPLVVQVTASSGTGANIPVQFSSSGPVTLSSTTATTDANGRASVNVNAGSVTGSATVTANVASATGVGSVTFQLTVAPPAPQITAANFVNGADLQPNSLSPCSTGAVVASPAALSLTNLAPMFPGLPIGNPNIKITINNIAAPILGVNSLANGQQEILFQVPCEVTPGNAVPATVNLGGGTTPVNLNIQAASPGVFQWVNPDGVIRAVIVRPDGSFATPQNPARRGETVVAYVTGLGSTSPSVGTQSLPVPGANANAQGTVIVGIAGQGVQLNSARLAQDLVGAYAVAFQIPSATDLVNTGDNLSFSIGVIPQGSSTPVYSATTKVPIQ